MQTGLLYLLSFWHLSNATDVENNTKTGEDQIQAAIPLLQLPPSSNQAVNVMQLLQYYIEEPFRT